MDDQNGQLATTTDWKKKIAWNKCSVVLISEWQGNNDQHLLSSIALEQQEEASEEGNEILKHVNMSPN